MKRFCGLTTLAVLMVISSVADGAESLKFNILGEWQNARSFYGGAPWDLCVLTIDKSFVSFSDPSAEQDAKRVPYKVILDTESTIIVEVASMWNICLRSDRPTYFRFDSETYDLCSPTSSERCPKPFDDNRTFELSIFKTKKDAELYKAGIIIGHGYFHYQKLEK